MAVKMEKQVRMKIVHVELKQYVRVSEHIIIKTAILKIVLSQIIIIIQRECNAVTLPLDIFYKPYGYLPYLRTV